MVSRLVLAGFLCYRSSGVVEGVSGEILVGLFDTDAVPPPGWHLSFLKGVMATLHLLPSVSGETLGLVRWSGSSVTLLLEGAAWYSANLC